MEDAIAIEKIRNAVEIATKKLIIVNNEEKLNDENEYDRQVFLRRGSFLNAMIYHEPVSNNYFSINDVHMECLYPKQEDDISDFHIQNIFRDRILEEFYMEVMHIRYGCDYEKIAIPRMMNSVVNDLGKLESSANSSNPIPVVGIMAVVNLTRYPGNSREYHPMNVMIDCLKKLLAQWKYSDNIVFILSDNFRAVSITVGEIRRYEE